MLSRSLVSLRELRQHIRDTESRSGHRSLRLRRKYNALLRGVPRPLLYGGGGEFISFDLKEVTMWKWKDNKLEVTWKFSTHVLKDQSYMTLLPSPPDRTLVRQHKVFHGRPILQLDLSNKKFRIEIVQQYDIEFNFNDDNADMYITEFKDVYKMDIQDSSIVRVSSFNEMKINDAVVGKYNGENKGTVCIYYTTGNGIYILHFKFDDHIKKQFMDLMSEYSKTTDDDFINLIHKRRDAISNKEKQSRKA